MRAIDEYRSIVGDKVISEIVHMAKNLYGLRFLHTSTPPTMEAAWPRCCIL